MKGLLLENMSREEETGKNPKWIFFLIIASIVISDQITKYLAVNLVGEKTVNLAGNIVYLSLVNNTGAAFGIFRNQNFLLSVLAGAFILVAGFYVFFAKDKKYKVVLSMILAGAAGNLIDRIRLGYVIDFFSIGFWPAFNVADSAITLGVAFLVLGNLLIRKNKGIKENNPTKNR